MKRQKDSQSKAIVFCLGIIAFLGLIAKVEVNHLHRFTGKRLRRHSHHHSMERHMEEEGIKAQSAMDFVPPHSLYKLEVEDIHGKIVDFSMFLAALAFDIHETKMPASRDLSANGLSQFIVRHNK